MCICIRAVIAQSVWRWSTGWTIGVLGFDSRRGLGIFLFTTASRTALGPTQLPVQWVPGALGGKAAGAWSWPLTSIYSRGQRMSGAIHPFPQYAFMAWCSVKAQGQLYLYLYSNYRRISLLPTTYKILFSILLSRLILYEDEIIGDHQCGF
jgi:hypothetical protein